MYLRFMVFYPRIPIYIMFSEDRMKDTALTRFRKDLDSFVIIISINMAAGGLAISVGMKYLVFTALDIPTLQVSSLLQLPAAVFFLICTGLGFWWLLSSIRILLGVKSVFREIRGRAGPVPEELLTCWIVRTLSHYRENRARVRWMVPVSVIGGVAFLLLGISNIVQGIMGTDDPLRWFAFSAASINMIIGIASIACALYFRRYSAAWDRRIETAARSENALQCALEKR